MTSLRRRLRLGVTAWLLVQVVLLSAALVPRDCCAAHQPITTVKPPSCHEQAAAPAAQCPMRASGGTACPMHGGGHGESEATPKAKCSMRGNCAGPMAALLTLLSNHGVLPGPLVTAPDLRVDTVVFIRPDGVIARLLPPDPRPPRA